MQYQFHTYLIPLILSALVTLSLGIYALFKRRNVQGGGVFAISMFVVTIWSAGNALEMAGLNLATKLFWANIQYFAYCYSPVALLALCMQFTGFERWVGNKKIWWLAILPTIIFFLVWTDPAHGLMRYNIHMDYQGAFPVIAKNYGPMFYVHAVYSHCLNISSWILVIRALFFKNSVYRNQAAALFAGKGLIIVPNILYVSGIGPVDRFDITPIFFGPAGLIEALAIFRFKWLDIVPLARATVFETMEAGYIVLDLQNRILDINPSVARQFGISVSKVLTRPVAEVFAAYPELVRICAVQSYNVEEFSINKNGEVLVCEIRLSPLMKRSGRLLGRLVTIVDITQRKLAQQIYLQQHWQLAVNDERERIARDLHDDLSQMLGFINFQAEGIRQELLTAGIGIADAEIVRLVAITQATHNEIRDYIKKARGTELGESDFMKELCQELAFFEEHSGLKVALDVFGGITEYQLEPSLQSNLLHIIKESLNNIRKHANASQVRVSLSLAGNCLCSEVEDDGRGFALDLLDNGSKAGFGLHIMRERAEEIGGRLEIDSVIGRGSRIALLLPIPDEEGGYTDESDVG